MLGMLDNTGSVDGFALGGNDGCNVGQCETEGCPEGWLLGAALIDGDSEFTDDG